MACGSGRSRRWRRRRVRRRSAPRRARFGNRGCRRATAGRRRGWCWSWSTQHGVAHGYCARPYVRPMTAITCEHRRTGTPGRVRGFTSTMATTLEGSTALVTGATAGIGRAIAQQLAALGAEVVVHGRNPERGAETVQAIENGGGKARFVAADLSRADDVRRLADEAGPRGTP